MLQAGQWLDDSVLHYATIRLISLLDALQLPEYRQGIFISLAWGLAVVAADGFPGVTVLLHAAGQDLRPALDVAAGISKRIPPIFSECVVPA